MFAWLLSLIPFVGKAVDAWAAHDQKKQDVVLEKYKVDGTVNVEVMRQDTEVIKARATLAAVMKDDPVNRWGRRFFIYPIGTWFAAIVYYCIFHPYFPEILPVLALPTQLDYIPYAVVAYLFVSAWKK
jgi:hypothetical protein